MTVILVRVAALLVRGWTRVYTSGLPEPLSTERRREIESDVWELQRDPDGHRDAGVAIQMLGRLLIGVPDDLLWRVDHVADDIAARRMAASVVVGALLLVAIWAGWSFRSPVKPLASGRVADCVNTAGPPQSTPELRLRIMDCAGTFFTPQRTLAPTPSRP